MTGLSLLVVLIGLNLGQCEDVPRDISVNAYKEMLQPKFRVFQENRTLQGLDAINVQMQPYTNEPHVAVVELSKNHQRQDIVLPPSGTVNRTIWVVYHEDKNLHSFGIDCREANGVGIFFVFSDDEPEKYYCGPFEFYRTSIQFMYLDVWAWPKGSIECTVYLNDCTDNDGGDGDGGGDGGNDNCDCPLRKGRIEALDRIFGGVEATPHEFPWMVSLKDTRQRHFCGGSLIEENWVLTAAQCVESLNPGDIRVILGEHDENVVSSNKQIRSVSEIIMHEDYNRNTHENDIALLRLSIDADINDDVKLACLPEQGYELTAGVDVIVAGWGAMQSGTISFTTELMKVTVRAVSDDVCRTAYGLEFASDSILCAGEEGKGFCPGDLGGPLIRVDNNCVVQVGVASQGNACADTLYPGVYASVSYYRGWITSNTQQY